MFNPNLEEVWLIVTLPSSSGSTIVPTEESAPGAIQLRALAIPGMPSGLVSACGSIQC